MASVDPLEDEIGFAERNQADFPLLSDTGKEVARAYWVFNDRGVAGRHTVYIDKNGTVVRGDTAVNPETSAEGIAAALGELGGAPALAE